MVYYNDDGDTVPIDFLTEGLPRESVEIRGQDGLVAQAYSGQRMLLENTRQVRAGQSLHALLEPERLIRVPTLGAYVIQKGVSAGTRLHTMKRAKDLVYILEIISHPRLGPIAFDQLPGISRKYGREAEAFRRVIEETIDTPALLDDVVEQMVISRGRRADPAATRAVYKGWLLRLLLAEG